MNLSTTVIVNSVTVILLILIFAWIGYTLGITRASNKRMNSSEEYGGSRDNGFGDPIRPSVKVGPIGEQTIYGGTGHSRVEQSYYSSENAKDISDEFIAPEVPSIPSFSGIIHPPIANPTSALPVPRGALKETSEAYSTPFYNARRPLAGTDFFRPYGPNSSTRDIVASSVPFYNKIRPPLTGGVASANAYAPFPEVLNDCEKVGILTSNDSDSEILNLYRRPIAPLQELWQYSVQDKDGFIILLKNVKHYLEDGDKITDIPGKSGIYTFNDFVQNKYVWI